MRLHLAKTVSCFFQPDHSGIGDSSLVLTQLSTLQCVLVGFRDLIRWGVSSHSTALFRVHLSGNPILIPLDKVRSGRQVASLAGKCGWRLVCRKHALLLDVPQSRKPIARIEHINAWNHFHMAIMSAGKRSAKRVQCQAPLVFIWIIEDFAS